MQCRDVFRKHIYVVDCGQISAGLVIFDQQVAVDCVSHQLLCGADPFHLSQHQINTVAERGGELRHVGAVVESHLVRQIGYQVFPTTLQEGTFERMRRSLISRPRCVDLGRSDAYVDEESMPRHGAVVTVGLKVDHVVESSSFALEA
ncbi:hypothetical protein AFM11_34690 [Mycolicibacterium wolinskyi]|uniref:Uncharacterized protein n=1 Tax=Mycolicibacterium wolinskyi TaxID=59750 RepID=A0A132PCH4_9MYCO|nr:hypothetical protein AFM11_34690 [Mycolicibacterium wolinskyi]